MLQNIAILVLFVVVFWIYVRFFERSQIFHPIRHIEFTPLDFGLKYEEITFTTPDGIQLHGWYIPVKSAMGTILFCHGNAGNIGHRMDTIQFFNEMNLNVYIFDYRGYGNSGGKPSEEGTYTDAMSAYNYLKSRGDIDISKLVYFGESLGGAIAVELATWVKPAGIIIDSSFTSIDAIGREVYPFLPIRWMIRTKYDSISKINKIHCPVFIAHSKEDEIVGFHHGEELFKEANEPKEFLVLQGTHNDSIKFVNETTKIRIKKFIDTILINQSQSINPVDSMNKSNP